MKNFLNLMKKTGFIFFLVSIFTLQSSPTKILAAVLDLPNITITNPMKPWTVTFTKEVDFETITEDSVKIYDQDKVSQPITLSVGASAKQCIITPGKPYGNNQTYQIFVSDKIKSMGGTLLKKEVYKSFTVKTDLAEVNTASANVRIGWFPAIKEITINSTTIPNVVKYSLKKDGTIFDLGEPGVTTADASITIYFYSEDKTLIGTGELPVEKAGSDLKFTVNLQI